MEFFLPPPPPFLALPGEPPVPWDRWLESFSTYLTAVGLADSPDQRLRALLLHNLGTEGQRVFRTLGAGTTYADGVAKLAAHFAAPQSVILRRVVFRQRRQQPGESVHHYVTDLRGLASFCKFGTMEDEFIRDQLAEHTNNPRIREKLIMSSDDLTLAKAVELAFQMESAAELASRLAPHLPHLKRVWCGWTVFHCHCCWIQGLHAPC
uniref:Retrotransposon gag domain-containing protein n=1 Tax=Denticeps clupeoides TaxID=299321 RepID=A0AAY4C3E4_9TELE